MNEQASDQASDAQNSPANGMEMHDRNVDAIAAFIETLDVAEAVKEELRALSPSTYTGVFR